MSKIKLYIFLEGYTDKLFFEKVFEKSFKNTYNVTYVEYATMPKDHVIDLIESIKKSQRKEYIFVTDLDSNQFSIKSRINDRMKNYGTEKDKIIVVVEEIESWYCAGINESKNLKSTDKVTKEIFEESNKDKDRIDFIMEKLKNFDLNKAINLNTSLKYFVNNFLKNNLGIKLI